MKIYWVLCWDQYYPYGGLDNVTEKFDTQEAADVYVAKIKEEDRWDNVEVINILNMLYD